jgi:hypothetical protein
MVSKRLKWCHVELHRWCQISLHSSPALTQPAKVLYDKSVFSLKQLKVSHFLSAETTERIPAENRERFCWTQ